MRVTRAVTHIRLCDVNHAKLAALDAVAAEYLSLCQQYTTYFCTEAEPDGYLAPRFESVLSQRWQRVAIQQAAGIARSWRSNHAAAHQDYLDRLAEFQERQEEQVDAEVEPPAWHEWQTPVLKETAIQSNANVALLQPSEASSFTYWLRLSTLEQRQPVWLPVRLAAYHQQALAGKTINGSMTLTRKPDGWWLTLTYDETVPVVTPSEAVVVGVDVGIVHFLTSSTGKHYGTFHGKLATTAPTGSRAAPPQGQAARLPQEERRAETPLDAQWQVGAERPARDQPCRQCLLRGPS